MIEEYHYKPTTLAKLRRAVRYGQNQLNLRDWQVELLVGGQPIGTAAQTDKGAVVYDDNTLRAKIWLNIEACRKEDFSALDVLFHELAHIAVGSRDDEFISNQMSNLLMRLYCPSIKPK